MKKGFLQVTALFMLTSGIFFGCSEDLVTLTAGGFSNGKLIIQSPDLSEEVVLTGGDSLQVQRGTSLSVEAQADPKYDFGIWYGIDSEEKRAFLSITDHMEISAEFVKTSYRITLDNSINGKFTIEPKIQSGKMYPANTLYTIKATPAEGYELDSVYSGVSAGWFTYFENMTDSTTVNLSSDMTLGASFIKSEELEGFSVLHDVVYARPGVKPLKYDVFTPDGAKELPMIIIVHGGGWSSNDENIMRGMAREIVRTGKYVVASIDYRWNGHLDGDAVLNSLNDLIGDVYGAIAHIMENAEEYGADPDRLAITGDSAGGHLSVSAATMIERIGDGGFGIESDVYEIMPSYLPRKMSASDFKDKLKIALKAVAPSYGVFDRKMLSRSLGTIVTEMSEEGIAVICPIENIPMAVDRSIPHYLVRGTDDPLIRDSDVRDYTEALTAAGQTAVYVQVQGASHAFYDWKPDSATKAVFTQIGIPNIHKMLVFFDQYL